jgi:hypothetical protein
MEYKATFTMDVSELFHSSFVTPMVIFHAILLDRSVLMSQDAE